MARFTKATLIDADGQDICSGECDVLIDRDGRLLREIAVPFPAATAPYKPVFIRFESDLPDAQDCSAPSWTRRLGKGFDGLSVDEGDELTVTMSPA